MSRFRFSPGTGPLVLGLLFAAFLAPWWLDLIRRGLPLPQGWPQTAVVLIFLAGFSLVPLFQAAQVCRRPELRTRRAWGEALAAVGLVLLLKGLWILIFAWAPTRFHSGPVPRAASAGYLAWGAVFAAAGGLLLCRREPRSPA